MTEYHSKHGTVLLGHFKPRFFIIIAIVLVIIIVAFLVYTKSPSSVVKVNGSLPGVVQVNGPSSPSPVSKTIELYSPGTKLTIDALNFKGVEFTIPNCNYVQQPLIEGFITNYSGHVLILILDQPEYNLLYSNPSNINVGGDYLNINYQMMENITEGLFSSFSSTGTSNPETNIFAIHNLVSLVLNPGTYYLVFYNSNYYPVNITIDSANLTYISRGSC
jgi:hypothetical protein